MLLVILMWTRMRKCDLEQGGFSDKSTETETASWEAKTEQPVCEQAKTEHCFVLGRLRGV